MIPALSLRELTVLAGRRGKRTLLRRVSLEFAGPGLYGIIGPNGAGKSTLIRSAIGLVPAAQGDVLIGGRALHAWDRHALARHIGYMPQQMISYWDLRVGELLRLGKHGLPEGLLDCCRIRDLLDRRLSTLSGGEQARVSLARALVHEPQLVFADEPAAHLDMPHQHAILQLLRAFAATRTVLVVLHDLHLASRYCDRVALLANGQRIAAGTPEEVLVPTYLNPTYGTEVTQIGSDRWAFYSVRDDAPVRNTLHDHGT